MGIAFDGGVGYHSFPGDEDKVPEKRRLFIDPARLRMGRAKAPALLLSLDESLPVREMSAMLSATWETKSTAQGVEHGRLDDDFSGFKSGLWARDLLIKRRCAGKVASSTGEGLLFIIIRQGWGTPSVEQLPLHASLERLEQIRRHSKRRD
jgi:hypothetical protein